MACGFDVMGFALEQPGDVIEVALTNDKKINLINETDFSFPLNPESNCAGKSVIEFLKHLNSSQGLEIRIKQKIRPGSGLGSSAASSVASLFAVNNLLGSPLSKLELVRFAMEGEKAASGAWHADNVAPSLLGGVVLIRSYDPLDIIQLPFPEALYCTVIHPHVEIKTKDARDLLPANVPLKTAINQWGNVGGLVAGLYSGDYELIGRALEDQVVEPFRAGLIPMFSKLKEEAMSQGALGCSISGSGPSVFAIAKGLNQANKIKEGFTKVFGEANCGFDVYAGKINAEGAKVIS